MERICEWKIEDIGKKVINDGRIGTFIARCEYPTFTIEFENGERIDAAIGSPMGKGWKIFEGLPDVDKNYLISFLENVLKLKVREVKFNSEDNKMEIVFK